MQGYMQGSRHTVPLGATVLLFSFFLRKVLLAFVHSIWYRNSPQTIQEAVVETRGRGSSSPKRQAGSHQNHHRYAPVDARDPLQKPQVTNQFQEPCKSCSITLQKLQKASEGKSPPADGETICDVSYLLGSSAEGPQHCSVCEFLLQTLASPGLETLSIHKGLFIHGYSVASLCLGINTDLRGAGTQRYQRSGWVFVINHYVDVAYTWLMREQLEDKGTSVFAFRKRNELTVDPNMGGNLAERLDLNDLQLVPDLLDFPTIRSWLRMCDRQCTKRNTDLFPQQFDTPLLLIDCHKRQVIQSSWKSKFIALSYVWGKDTERPCIDTVPFNLPQACKATIEDSIVVTVELGFQYLWVDAFCISSSSHVKHDQIARMDLVYSQARLTIIAAAGNDSTHGLPGVSSRRKRGRQPYVVTRERAYNADTYVLTSMLPERAAIMSRAAYSTRAWTYQEEFFSKHHLIFSEDQVYYECPFISSRESLFLPLETMKMFRVQAILRDPTRLQPIWRGEQGISVHESRHSKPQGFKNLSLQAGSMLRRYPVSVHNTSIQREGSRPQKVKFPDMVLGTSHYHLRRRSGQVRSKPFNGDFVQHPSHRILPSDRILDIFFDHVVHYSPRKLTYERDSLLALRAVLRYFSRWDLLHYCGIPYTRGSTAPGHSTAGIELAVGLSWSHGENKTALKRRAGFPSWSWAGWDGAVNWARRVTACEDTEFWARESRDYTTHFDFVDVQRRDFQAYRQFLKVKTSAWLSIKLEKGINGEGTSDWYLPSRKERTDPHLSQINQGNSSAKTRREAYRLEVTPPDADEIISSGEALYAFPLTAAWHLDVFYLLVVYRFQRNLRGKKRKELSEWQRLGLVKVSREWLLGSDKTENCIYLV